MDSKLHKFSQIKIKLKLQKLTQEQNEKTK